MCGSWFKFIESEKLISINHKLKAEEDFYKTFNKLSDTFILNGKDYQGTGININEDGTTYVIETNQLNFKIDLSEIANNFESSYTLRWALSSGEGTLNALPTTSILPIILGENSFVFNLTTDPGGLFFLLLEVKNENGIKENFSIPLTTTPTP